MKQNYTLLMIVGFLLSGITMYGQTRYIDDVFSAFDLETDITYGTNISILTGEPMAQDLKMQVYTPAGDDLTDRPVVLVAHTGNFLPAYLNGGTTGSMSDSTVVNICKRLTKKGYVAAAFTYRQGWLPLAEDQDTRTGTLLQAAYRGCQDARTAVRYLRKSVAEDGNPYGIDPEKIGMWGIGTGSYVAFSASTLDDYEEVTIDKFLNSQTLLPLADTTLLGNFWATTQAPLCLPNHVDYSSDFLLCTNLGGGMGDLSWLDGKDNEPAFVGYHSVGDVFAPFAEGPVIVPTTMQFVVNVSGTKSVVKAANELGNNDVMKGLLPEFDPYKDYIDALKNIELTFQGGFTTEIGEDNMYTFIRPVPEGSPWDWWDKATLDVIIPQVNALFGTDLNSDTLHLNGLITNPDMSAEKGNLYLDTIFTHWSPRACLAMGLGCAVSSVDEISAVEVGLEIFPNPVLTETTIRVNPDQTIEKVYLYNSEGRLVQGMTSVNASVYKLKRNDLSSGVYFAKISLEDGIVTKQILFE